MFSASTTKQTISLRLKCQKRDEDDDVKIVSLKMGPVNITEMKKKHDHLWLSHRKLTKTVRASVVAEDDADALNCHHISQFRESDQKGEIVRKEKTGCKWSHLC